MNEKQIDSESPQLTRADVDLAIAHAIELASYVQDLAPTDVVPDPLSRLLQRLVNTMSELDNMTLTPSDAPRPGTYGNLRKITLHWDLRGLLEQVRTGHLWVASPGSTTILTAAERKKPVKSAPKSKVAWSGPAECSFDEFLGFVHETVLYWGHERSEEAVRDGVLRTFADKPAPDSPDTIGQRVVDLGGPSAAANFLMQKLGIGPNRTTLSAASKIPSLRPARFERHADAEDFRVAYVHDLFDYHENPRPD